MTKRNATKRSNLKAEKADKLPPLANVEPLKALLSGPPKPPAPMPFTFTNKLLDAIDAQVKDNSMSTARYMTIKGDHINAATTVCFHAIAEACKGKDSLVLTFQGYPGFSEGDRWRKATEEDLYTNKTYPFVQKGGDGGYTNESLKWLEFLLDPTGPFKSLLPLMAENTPEAVQSRRAFVFPDVSLIPARLTWCFAIAQRLGYANTRTLWRYLHLLEKGLPRATAALMAGGFEHEVVNQQLTGKIIKSYTCGFLGVDTTAYAGRFLTSSPVEDKSFKDSKPSSYGSAEVFKSGKIDIKNLRFDDWTAAELYTVGRMENQVTELKLKVAA